MGLYLLAMDHIIGKKKSFGIAGTNTEKKA
jgi:hypothetical protein